MVQIVDPGRWEVAPFKGIDLPARAPSLGCLHIVGFFVVHAVGGILPPEGQPDQRIGLLRRWGRFPVFIPPSWTSRKRCMGTSSSFTDF